MSSTAYNPSMKHLEFSSICMRSIISCLYGRNRVINDMLFASKSKNGQGAVKYDNGSDAKYEDKTLVKNSPHKLNPDKEKQVRQLALDAYIATGCSGFARVDIFMTEAGDFFLNEINTYPGMTKTSLFAELWQVTDNTSFTQLLDKLIAFAEDKFEQEKNIQRGR